MDEIPRDFDRDNRKMSPAMEKHVKEEAARFAKIFPPETRPIAEVMADHDPFVRGGSRDLRDTHTTNVLSDVLAELRIARDSTKGSLAEQVAYELRRRSGSTGGAPTWGVTQTITGEDGNCLEAAIATVLGCELADVPRLKDHTWDTQLTDWLTARGLSWSTSGGDKPPQGLSIAVGPSPRRTVSHAVVAVSGKLAFDPHPDRTFFGDKPPKYFIELEGAASRVPSESPPAQQDKNF